MWTTLLVPVKPKTWRAPRQYEIQLNFSPFYFGYQPCSMVAVPYIKYYV